MKGQNFASQLLSRHTFRISRKKGSEFFDHRGTLRRNSAKVRVTSGQKRFNEIIYIVLETSVRLYSFSISSKEIISNKQQMSKTNSKSNM